MNQEKMYEVVLEVLPGNKQQMLAMSEADLTKPENTAALAIATLNLYPADKNAALEMLAYLQGPQEVTPYEKQFLEDRFRNKDYVPRSYFKGATPENDYEPEKPYRLQFFENPYSRQNLEEGYLILYVNSGGADNARQVKLRKKNSTGQWFLWEQFLLADIRKPVSADSWA